MLNEIPLAVIEALGDVLRRNGYLQKEAERRLKYKFGTWYTAFAPTFLFPLFALNIPEKNHLNILLLLFYCCQPVFSEQLKIVIGERLFEDLQKCQLISLTENRVEAAIQIIPFDEDLLVATERPEKGAGQVQYVSFARDAVMTLFPDSYDLAKHIKSVKATTALDLFCGNGVQSLILARRVTRVLGVDSNEKALEFAKFNAALNQLHNIEFVCRDLNQPIHDLGRFEVVVANPPFCPAKEQKTLFCDGGPTGDTFIKLLLRERLAEVIEESGTAFIIFTLALKRTETAKDKVDSLLPGNLGYNTVFVDLEKPELEPALDPLHAFLVYFVASQHLKNPAEYAPGLKALFDHIQELGVESMAYGLLKLENIHVRSMEGY